MDIFQLSAALCGPRPAVTASWFTACCAVLLAGKVLLLALHSLSHSVVEVVVARLDHLGYQLEEGVRSEVVGMAILHASPAHPVRLAGMVSRRPKVSSDHKMIYFETFLSRMSFSHGRIG